MSHATRRELSLVIHFSFAKQSAITSDIFPLWITVLCFSSDVWITALFLAITQLLVRLHWVIFQEYYFYNLPSTLSSLTWPRKKKLVRLQWYSDIILRHSSVRYVSYTEIGTGASFVFCSHKVVFFFKKTECHWIHC